MALGHKATRTRPTRHAENGGGLAVLKQNASGGSDPPTTGKGSNGSMLKACSAKCRAWHYYRDVSRTHWWVCAFLDGGPWHAAFLSLSSHLVHTRVTFWIEHRSMHDTAPTSDNIGTKFICAPAGTLTRLCYATALGQLRLWPESIRIPGCGKFNCLRGVS